MGNCKQNGHCANAFRSAYDNVVHCRVQADGAKKWDFCAHQYLCNRSRRYELDVSASQCALLREPKEETKQKKSTTREKKSSEPKKKKASESQISEQASDRKD